MHANKFSPMRLWALPLLIMLRFRAGAVCSVRASNRFDAHDEHFVVHNVTVGQAVMQTFSISGALQSTFRLHNNWTACGIYWLWL